MTIVLNVCAFSIRLSTAGVYTQQAGTEGRVPSDDTRQESARPRLHHHRRRGFRDRTAPDKNCLAKRTSMR